MAESIGMAQHRLDAIELRLVGCDHRPWRFYDSLLDGNGKPLVGKGSKKVFDRAANRARVTANGEPVAKPFVVRGSEEQGVDDDYFDTGRVRSGVGLFQLVGDATNDMAEFVANAPQDVDDLLTEVKFLRMRLEKSTAEREEFRKEMLSLRVEAAALRDKLAEMRGAWKTLTKVMEPRP